MKTKIWFGNNQELLFLIYRYYKRLGLKYYCEENYKEPNERHNTKGLFLDFRKKIIEFWYDNDNNLNLFKDSFKEYYFIDLSFSPEVYIGDYKVEFFEDKIKVGCTEVTKETVNKIYERMNK